MQKTSSAPTQNNKVLITGATSGIGYALAKKYLSEGWQVIGIGRDISKVQDLLSNFRNNFDFFEIDLSDFKNLNKNFSDVLLNHKNLNTIIFNAGIYIPDSYENFSFKNAKESFDINVLSIYFAIEILRKEIHLDFKHTLAIVSSVAGYRGLPKSILYGPTKAALINLCESLRVDLPKEVNIKLINPGFVETPATSVNNFKMPFLMTAEKAASIIFSRIYKKGFEISFPFPFNFMMKFGSILPYNIYFKFTDYISRK
tara:strand:+ start:1341 stop:2111 length:771 start_codon:yes stop_codon:yes gene_type:complete